MDLQAALSLARDSELDLVEVAPNESPPVCKLLDYGKFKYESGLRAREARKRQVRTTVKEMKFRVRIGEQDFQTKRGHVARFLEQGDKVKVTIMFRRGRELGRPELGRRLLHRLAEELSDMADIESHPAQLGANMTMLLAPKSRRKTASR